MGLATELMTAHFKTELETKLQVLSEKKQTITVKSQEKTTAEIKYTTV